MAQSTRALLDSGPDIFPMSINTRRRSKQSVLIDQDVVAEKAKGDKEDHQTDSSKRVKLNSKNACSRCRALKARCEVQQPSNGKCVRCTRLSFDCVWVQGQKRGRRANSTRLTMQTANIATSEEGSAGHAARKKQNLTNSNDPPPIFHHDATQVYSFERTSSPHLVHNGPLLQHDPAAAEPSPSTSSQRSRNPHSSVHEDTSPHSHSTLPNLSMVDLAQAKEKALQDLNAPRLVLSQQKRPTKVDSQPEADPIDMHVLSELDARQLFDHYHHKMNAFIILLDPVLHTVDFVRKSSSVLFSTILAVSAKFIRPSLYQLLLKHAKQLVGRGVIDGSASVGLIQSILMQVYWKEPDDSSAWLRIGEAIRMCYQLHLHRQRTEDLPDDEFEARLIIDKERTWIDLCAFDQTFFLQSAEEEDGFHQTCMIPHFRVNVKSWLEETKHFGVKDDLEQGANFEWIKMQRLTRDIHRARPANARALGQYVEGTLKAAYQQYLDASSKDAFTVETRPWIRVNFWLAAASLARARAMLIAIGNEGDLLAEWVVASSAFVDALEIVAKWRYIQYWQDTLGITLYSMGEFSVKIFTEVHPATQPAIVGWMERIYRACELCADGHTDSTAAFISRFFQLCLRAVCLRPNTPDAASHVGDFQSGQISQRSFPTPWTNTAQAPLASFHDASYWESIFPGVTTDWSWLVQSLEEEMPAPL